MIDEYSLVEQSNQPATIKVIGVGGGGCNSVRRMSEGNLHGVELIAANTDLQHLRSHCRADHLVQIGVESAKGQGAGSKPDAGRKAAEEDIAQIKERIQGSDLLFIAAGMGGGTGTGAAPVIAKIARELGILTVAVVTRPFKFEGRARLQSAEAGLTELAQYVDSLILIPNDKLLTTLPPNTRFEDAFSECDNVLYNAVKGISDIIMVPGIVNTDFADVRTVMQAQGMAMMGKGSATGENRARVAAQKALSCPLLDDLAISNAEGLLINICSDGSMTLSEYSEISEIATQVASENASIKIGASTDKSVGGELLVTIIATGLSNAVPNATPKPVAQPASAPVRDNPKVVTLPDHRFATAQNTQPAPQTPPPTHRDPRTQYGQQNTSNPNSEEYLNIPAFLRRQAD